MIKGAFPSCNGTTKNKENEMKRTKLSSILAKISIVASLCLLFSGCFIFYGGSIDGFWVDGIYDGSEKITRCTDDTVRSLLQWSSDSFENFPDDSENCGSIVYPICTTCFTSETASGFNAFAFVSPPLTTWNDVTGYIFRIKTSIPGDYLFGRSLQVQPMLEIEHPDGNRVFHIMVDEDDFDRPIKFEVPNDADWHTYTYTRPTINPDDTVIGLSVVVFIPNEAIANLEQINAERGPYAEERGFVYLDAVVPLRP
jgi:hypothetical protein